MRSGDWRARCAAADLEIEGLRVVEPWGVLTTELAQQRHRAQPDLQRQADRLASQLGRARTVTDAGHGRGHRVGSRRPPSRRPDPFATVSA